MSVRLRARRITVTAVSSVHTLNVTQFGQQIERAIHGGQAQMRIRGLGLLIDFGRRQVSICCRHNLEHGLTRPCQLAMIFL